MNQMTDMPQAADFHAHVQALRAHLNTQLIGREQLIDRLLMALLTSGHVLIEGAPGLAKTLAIKRFADSIDASFVRIQATPDLLPADLTGTTIFQPEKGDFRFARGPLFNNVVLMDEINRAPPKVQSALLEAMAENQISVAGETYPLARPFLVAATQNPIEHEGTYPLPEAQLDRFLFCLQVPMPGVDEERQILDLSLARETATAQQAVASSGAPSLDAAQIAQISSSVAAVHIAPAVRDYVVRLVAATRGEGAAAKAAIDIEHAASPRGSIGLARAAQAAAWLDGRDHVLPDDVRELAPDVLAGRIGLSYRAKAQGRSERDVIQEIIAGTPAL